MLEAVIFDLRLDLDDSTMAKVRRRLATTSSLYRAVRKAMAQPRSSVGKRLANALRDAEESGVMGELMCVSGRTHIIRRRQALEGNRVNGDARRSAIMDVDPQPALRPRPGGSPGGRSLARFERSDDGDRSPRSRQPCVLTPCYVDNQDGRQQSRLRPSR